MNKLEAWKAEKDTKQEKSLESHLAKRPRTGGLEYDVTNLFLCVIFWVVRFVLFLTGKCIGTNFL